MFLYGPDWRRDRVRGNDYLKGDKLGVTEDHKRHDGRRYTGVDVLIKENKSASNVNV